jgi:hypothetical protein
MKNVIVSGIMAFALGLVVPETAWSQGTLTYITSLNQPSAGSAPVGSDSLLAAGFETGNNSSGYAFDSIQLAMMPASGAPNSFTVNLYSSVSGFAVLPGSSLGTLSGSSDPETSGLYTYTASDLTLSPNTYYFIVLTAGTTVASGAYAWSYANSPASSSGGWGGDGSLLNSSDGGSLWNASFVAPQFALTATAVPEPGTLSLLGLSGLLFLIWHRWQAKAHSATAR